MLSKKCQRTKASLVKWPEDCFFTYSCEISRFEDIGININVWIQKPGVVSNNSVNINFSQNVLGTENLACEMIINLPLFTYSCRVNSFEDIVEMYRSRFKNH